MKFDPKTAQDKMARKAVTFSVKHVLGLHADKQSATARHHNHDSTVVLPQQQQQQQQQQDPPKRRRFQRRGSKVPSLFFSSAAINPLSSLPDCSSSSVPTRQTLPVTSSSTMKDRKDMHNTHPLTFKADTQRLEANMLSLQRRQHKLDMMLKHAMATLKMNSLATAVETSSSSSSNGVMRLRNGPTSSSRAA